MAAGVKGVIDFFLRPRTIVRSYERKYLRGDLIAGLTVAVMMLPQGIAYAQIAELPPEFGLHAGIVAAIVGGLWGSSRHLQTGPTNTVSLIVVASLATVATSGTTDFIVAAGLMTIVAGVLQLTMGVARLGVLANFVSHSVIVGFTSGAAVLIAVNQLKSLFGLSFASHGHGVAGGIRGVMQHVDQLHVATTALGVSTIAFMLLARKLAPKLPAALLSMVGCGLAVAVLSLGSQGVSVIGALPRGLPPLTDFSGMDLELIGRVATGALAIAAIGMTESMAIARSISTVSGQRLDPNQEMVGQGLSNIAAGALSGFAGAGSFTRSAVNVRAGARTQMAGVFTGLFVLLALVALAPLAATVPKAALAGVLIVTAYFMVDKGEIKRIMAGPRGDRLIMAATFVGTLVLPLEFAVVIGVLISFGLYIKRSSTPTVVSVLPADNYRRLAHRPDKPVCPQLAILDIRGDLYFGAVTQIEEAILTHLEDNPDQRYILLRMHSVNQCDFSGIHGLETVLRTLHERGGQLFLIQVQPGVMNVMKATGLYDRLGEDHFLPETSAIGHIFTRTLDPAICIYECEVRAFKECQSLPKRPLPLDPDHYSEAPDNPPPALEPLVLWEQLHSSGIPPRVIDVREPREFKRGHLPEADLIPLPKLVVEPPPPDGRPMVLICRGGRRSRRAAAILIRKGYENVSFLRGGMLAWQASGLLDAVEDPTRQYTPIRPPLSSSDAIRKPDTE